MKRTIARSALRTVLALLMLVAGMRTLASAQSVNAHENRIVGVWDVQVKVLDCSTGDPIASFRGLHKYELGGTAQVVPSTNPAALSPHVGIWTHVAGNRYRLSFKMFRFDGAGNYIGWNVVKNDVAINEHATAYAGSGKAEVFDSNGNSLGASCPTFSGTRFQ